MQKGIKNADEDRNHSSDDFRWVHWLYVGRTCCLYLLDRLLAYVKLVEISYRYSCLRPALGINVVHLHRMLKDEIKKVDFCGLQQDLFAQKLTKAS